MHIVTHLSPKYEAMRNSDNGWSEQEAGMAQLDDDIGLVMKKLKDIGEDENTIVVFTTDNGTEVFTWPDGGQTPFAQSKGTVMEGGFRVPAIVRWPGQSTGELDPERHLLRARLAADLRRRRRKPEHHRGAAEGQDDRRPHLQEPSGRLQPAGRSHRQGPIGPARDLLPRREHGRRGAHRRLQVPLHRPAERLAGREDPSGRALHHQPAARSVRADGLAEQRHQGRRPAVLRLVQVPVLALRLRPAGHGQGTPDLPRLPADAARRELQPRRRQGGDGEEDGAGRGGQQGTRTGKTSRRCGRPTMGRPLRTLDSGASWALGCGDQLHHLRIRISGARRSRRRTPSRRDAPRPVFGLERFALHCRTRTCRPSNALFGDGAVRVSQPDPTQRSPVTTDQLHHGWGHDRKKTLPSPRCLPSLRLCRTVLGLAAALESARESRAVAKRTKAEK